MSFGLNSVSMLKLEQLLFVFYFLLTQYMLNVPQTKIIMQTMQPSSCLEVFVVPHDVAVAGFVLLPLQSHQHAL